jgi:LCP family protein required for cell wall assembly
LSSNSYRRFSTTRVSKPTPSRAFIAAFLSALVPGTGQLYAGKQRRGWILVAISAVLLLIGAYFLGRGRTYLLKLTVQPRWVMAMLIFALVLLAFRLFAIFDAFRSVRATKPKTNGATIGIIVALVGLLFINAVPHLWAARNAWAQYDLITTVFAADEPADAGPAATDTTTSVEPDPNDSSVVPGVVVDDTLTTTSTQLEVTSAPLWEEGERVNILLMGGDAGVGRTSTRTDTMMVLSVDPETGYAALLGVPRNLVQMPFPPGPANDEYPDGFPDTANAIWRYGADNPDKFPGAADPASAAIKQSIGELMGIDVHYYALVNLIGFVDMIDAVGGIDIYVPEQVNDAEYPHEDGTVEPITIEAGEQEMDGHTALAYARSRRESDDYNRMNRQRCVLEALAESTDAVTLLTAFPRLAEAIKRSMLTDIPIDRLPDLIELVDVVDTEEIVTARFIPERFVSGYSVDRFPIPDQALIRQTVATIFELPPLEAIEVLDLQSLDEACPTLETAAAG